MPARIIIGAEDATKRLTGAAIDGAEFVRGETEDDDYVVLRVGTMTLYATAPTAYDDDPADPLTRCAVCGDLLTEEEIARVRSDVDFVEHGDRYGRHLIRIESPKPKTSDAAALDVLAEYLRETPDWNGGDFCELAARVVAETGREV